MSAPLTAAARTIGALLSGSTFEVPAYQRDYAWQDTEVDEFWRDLSAAVGREPYFLGLIILTGEEKRKQVVDGQQRLLTVTLLASAIRRQAQEIGRRALADRIESTLLRAMDYTSDEFTPRVVLTDPRANDTLHLLTGGPSRDALRVLPGGQQQEGSSSERLTAAYLYFMDAFAAGSKDEIFRRLGDWAAFIDDQLYVAVFEHPDESAAYSVFEVVNTRGRQLTTADLLKNYVLRNTPANLREARYNEWQAVAKQFEGITGQGLVPYIRHVINLHAGYVLPKDLYSYMAHRGEYADQSSISVDSLIHEMTQQLPLYLQLVDPTFGGPAEAESLEFFAAFNALSVTAVRPLLLAISETEGAIGGLQYVLRATVKRMVVGNLGAGGVERKFADAAMRVKETGSWQSAVEALEDMEHSRTEFVQQLARRSYNKNILTFLMRSIAQQSITPRSIGTLHFIRPRQAPELDWPRFSDEEASFWASTVGNSLLANVNRRPSDASTWIGVREHLLSAALPNQIAQALAELRNWTPTALAQRGTDLAEAAADVWF